MNKQKFCFLCKTFQGDFIYVKRLLESFKRFNTDSIQLVLCFPEGDRKNFDEIIDISLLDNIHFIYEEFFSKYLIDSDLVTPEYTIRPGYINQEIIKLAFWELDFAESYMPVDSDAEFIRSFGYKDFLTSDGVPYTILLEDNELQVDPIYYNKCSWEKRKQLILKIAKVIDYEVPVLLTAHGFCILSSAVLLNFFTVFMLPNNYTYVDLMKISPYEFSWYNLWLQKTQVIPLHYREPLFKYFHTYDQLKWYRWQGITREDISRGYLGIVVNSNFQPGRGEDNPLCYENTDIPTFYIGEPKATECINLLLRKFLRLFIKIPRIGFRLFRKVIRLLRRMFGI